MNRIVLFAAPVLAASTLVASCGFECGDEACRFDIKEWEAIQALTPLPDKEPDPTNRYVLDPAAARLGQKLFFESRYSGSILVGATDNNGGLGEEGETGKAACAVCHDPNNAFADQRSQPNNVSLGTRYTTRNTPTLINVRYYDFHGWGGKQDSLWCQASLSPESSRNSRGDRCGYAHMLWEHYREEYNSVFENPLPQALDPQAPDADRFPQKCKPGSGDQDPWEMMAEADRNAVLEIMANQGKAVAAYEWKLVSRNSPFDQYVAGDEEAMSDAAKRGLDLFMGKAACVDCHNTPIFSDNEYHNLGLTQAGLNLPDVDEGRFAGVGKLLKHAFNSRSPFRDGADPGKLEGLTPNEADRGKFRTPGLRNIAQTAPYMHNGAYQTLAEVIEHYDRGGDGAGFDGEKSVVLKPLFLTEREKTDLVAFLESLTGEDIPEDLRTNPLQSEQ